MAEKCKCTFSQRLQGDGCEVCNPEKAIELIFDKYHRDLRFDKNHHLGLGDIRLTISQQDALKKEIIDFVRRVYC